MTGTVRGMYIGIGTIIVIIIIILLIPRCEPDLRDFASLDVHRCNCPQLRSRMS